MDDIVFCVHMKIKGCVLLAGKAADKNMMLNHWQCIVYWKCVHSRAADLPLERHIMVALISIAAPSETSLSGTAVFMLAGRHSLCIAACKAAASRPDSIELLFLGSSYNSSLKKTCERFWKLKRIFLDNCFLNILHFACFSFYFLFL